MAVVAPGAAPRSGSRTYVWRRSGEAAARVWRRGGEAAARMWRRGGEAAARVWRRSSEVVALTGSAKRDRAPSPRKR